MTLRLILLIALVASPVFSFPQQKRATPPRQNPPNEDDVIKVRTNVVQVDAVVTDKSGKAVTDLTLSDFEVLEDGKPVKTEYFSFVPLVVQHSAQTETGLPQTMTAEPVSKDNLKRTFVFLVDNPLLALEIVQTNALGVSTKSLSFTPRAIRAAAEAERILRWFVDTQLSPNDLVAISDTEMDIGVLKSFTNDRELLRAAIASISENAASNKKQVLRLTSINGDTGIEVLLKQNLSVIQTLSGVIDQMSQLPGRKIVSLLSRGMVYDSRLPGSEVVRLKMQELVAKANRSQVSIYTMSPSGIGNLGGVSMFGSLGAAPGAVNPMGIVQGMQDVDSMLYLAKETGGRAIYSTNDARVGFAEVLEENRGYYLLGYNPGPEAVERPHKLKVNVKRPGLKVQARSTAYAKNATTVVSTPEAALNLPVAFRDIKVDLTPLYISADGRKSRLLSIVHIDLNGIKFTAKVPVLNMAVRVTGPDGNILKEESSQISIKSGPDISEKQRQEGITSVSALEDAIPGYYRVAVAVTEPGTGLTGSTSIFIEVANPVSDKLSASSLIVSKPSVAGSEELNVASLAERQFGSRSQLSYQCMVYNASSKGSNNPQVQLQLTIKRGETTVTSAATRLVTGTSGSPITIGGIISLPDLSHGTYLLEIAVEDTNRKRSVVTRSASFEVR